MNSPSPLISEPRFPPDLEREIFEICALSRPRTIPSLMLVASRVKEWVEPLLYRIIAVSDSRNESLPPFTCDILVRTIRAKPVHFLAKYVRHLYLTPGRRNDREHVSDILPACTGVTSLFTLWALHDAVFLTLLENMHSLRQLAVSVSSLFVPNNGFEHRLFRNITHLRPCRPSMCLLPRGRNYPISRI
ncbi:hypothetical protein B0H17DRAFT_545601 [Mycena rosella]|uniref:Uncharacterized protein n=1 Tax=Mycena rosella TaxID=1033263 RepID=A0AAD7BSY8_MYCRO|nr:hypothetical protein B0H17DRAFT_545601 [Mycena rosella]